MTSSSDAMPTPSFGIQDINHLVAHDLPEIAIHNGETLKDIHDWLAAVQGKKKPTITHPRIALFLASYESGGADMMALLDEMRKPGHPISALASVNNADFQVHELGLAASEDDMLHAVAYGMMAATAGIDLMIVSLLNPAHEAVAADLIAQIKKGVSPVQALLATGSLDFAAGFGAMIAARLARMPVITDGDGAMALKQVIAAIKGGMDNHIRAAASILPTQTALPSNAAGAFMIPVLKNIAAMGF